MDNLWKPVGWTPSQPLKCEDCEHPLGTATRYVHAEHNDRVFCSALCCVAFYTLQIFEDAQHVRG